MERRRNLPRTKNLPSRNCKMTGETLNFRKVARQVMLANMFTRTRPNAQSVTAKMAAGLERRPRAGTKTERKQGTMEEKSPLKRRGTPELFPMSEEMRQTVISLGKMDLLPDEDRESVEDDVRVGKTRTGSKFRDKTRQRIIHPQRFLRNVRSSLNNSKNIVENSVHCEKDLNEEDNDCNEGSEDEGKCFTNEKISDSVLITAKSHCNVLSRPNSTQLRSTAKRAKSQYFPMTRRPLCVTRYSDLGPVSAKPRVSRNRSQGTWPVNVFADVRIQASTRTQHCFPKKGKNTVKAWATGSEIAINTDESGENRHEMLKSRRCKSVESLTREIEEKCFLWLRNRYGIVQ